MQHNDLGARALEPIRRFAVRWGVKAAEWGLRRPGATPEGPPAAGPIDPASAVAPPTKRIPEKNSEVKFLDYQTAAAYQEHQRIETIRRADKLHAEQVARRNATRFAPAIKLIEQAATDRKNMSYWPDRAEKYGAAMRVEAAQLRDAAEALRTRVFDLDPLRVRAYALDMLCDDPGCGDAHGGDRPPYAPRAGRKLDDAGVEVCCLSAADCHCGHRQTRQDAPGQPGAASSGPRDAYAPPGDPQRPPRLWRGL